MSGWSGGRGSSMADWFDEFPGARDDVELFLHTRNNGGQESVRSLLLRLQKHRNFPFTSEPSLARYLKADGLAPIQTKVEVEESEGFDKNHTFLADRSRMSKIKSSRRWVVTAAQNNTEPDFDFLAALEHYCKDRSAVLIVRPLRYNNPTSRLGPDDETNTKGMWWHESLEPHLIDEEIMLKDVVIPDVRIQATAANPLTGLDSRSGTKHGVYASTQLQMKTVPTRQNDIPKILYSTGAVTVENYSTTKAGNLAQFHHSASAIVIEQDKSGRTFLRAISWDGEKFFDINIVYSKKGQQKFCRWSALVPGDEHAWFVDPNVLQATYTGEDSMVKVGEPKFIVHHDVLDCYSVSHHHMGKGIQQVNKTLFGRGCLRTELEDTILFLNKVSDASPFSSTHLVVQSNHHDHLTQWLNMGEKAVTPENALIYHEMMVAVLKSSERTDTGVKYKNPFEAYCERKLSGNTKFLSDSDSFMIEDIDVAMHGHRGPNGARGSAMNLSKIGVKSIIGHSHSPNIVKGVTQVGTSSRLDLEYAGGPSSWLHCHAIIHENGKRQLLPIIEGKWRA